MLSSIEDVLRAAGKHVIIAAGHSDRVTEIDSIEFLASRQCDALILHVYAISDDFLIELSDGPVPIVVIGRRIREMDGSCISIDNEYGGYLAARCLIELGHSEIACIAGPLWKSDGQERLAGFRRALSEYGLEFNEKLLAEGDYEEASGRQGMRRLLQRDIPFSGLFCANDEMAAGAIAIARQNGMTIPDDLSVIGFDNVFFTRYMNPALSTVTYPIDEMGRMAARCVLKNVYGENGQDIQNRFEAQMVRRASTTGHG